MLRLQNRLHKWAWMLTERAEGKILKPYLLAMAAARADFRQSNSLSAFDKADESWKKFTTARAAVWADYARLYRSGPSISKFIRFVIQTTIGKVQHGKS